MSAPSEKAWNLVDAVFDGPTHAASCEARGELLVYIAALEADRRRLDWCARRRARFLGRRHRMDWQPGDDEHLIEWNGCGNEVSEARARPDFRAAIDAAMQQDDAPEQDAADVGGARAQ